MFQILSFGFFTTSLVLATIFISDKDLNAHLNLLFITLGISSLIYLKLLRLDQVKLPSFIIIISILSCALLTPAYLQNDQYRYVWDGLNIVNGINPYQFAPVNNPLFNQFEWTQLINHPSLTTIYPPLAEALFAVSTYLNPYFLFDTTLKVTNANQVLLGWKLLVGLISVAIYLLYKRDRWDLILCHPLYLYTVFANTHIDMVMVLLISIVLKSLTNKKDSLTILSMVSAVLIKWYPLIFFPGVLVWLKKNFGKMNLLSNSILAISILVLSIILFLKGSDAQMFSSLNTYGEEWFFNGYIHHVLLDIFQFFMPILEAISISKIICFILATICYFFFLFLLIKEKITTKRWLLYTALTYLTLVPTLMPWYLLILLPFSLEYGKKNILLWLWPILTLSSKTFFYNNEDPVIVRYIFFIIISYFLYQFIKNEKKELLTT